MNNYLIRLCTIFGLWCGFAVADDLAPLTTDSNGDGTVRVLAFGDSITYGVGDNGLLPDSPVSGGYPNRAEKLLGIPFDNRGAPGEKLSEEGTVRALSLYGALPDDYVLIFEGANDAYQSVSIETYRAALQRTVNAALVFGKIPVVITLPLPCCNHAAQSGLTVRYSEVLRTVSLAYDIPLIDIEKAWDTSCLNRTECELYNVPEGLHPNAKGYDVISQTVAARFLGIDIFSDGGARELEQALGLPEGTVIVRPELSSGA